MMDDIRQIDVTGLEVVGVGKNAEVFKIDDDRILKLYRETVNKEVSYSQYMTSKYAYDYGINTAKVYEYVQCGERYGIIFEYIKAQKLAKYMRNSNEDSRVVANKLGRMLAQFHSIKVDSNKIPPLKTVYRSKVERFSKFMTDEQIERAVALIDLLPGKPVVLHGDFHKGNIFVKDDEFLVIDLDNMSVGSPMFDFIKMYCTEKITETDLPEEMAQYYRAAGITDEMILEYMLSILEGYFGTDDRNTLLEYDAIFTKMSKFYRFYAPLFTYTDDDIDVAKKYVEENLPVIEELFEDTKKDFSKLPWEN